jgi:hypothetical protein
MEIFMRIFGTALLALTLASPAVAQTSSIDPKTTTDPGAVAGPKSSESSEPRSSDSNNVQVYNEENEKLGDASEILVNSAGRVEGVIVKIADTDPPQGEVIVPLERLKESTDEKRLVVAATKDELRAMPKLQDVVPDTRANSKPGTE